MSATQAQNEFGRLLDGAISGQHVVITRHGRPAAVLLSAHDYEKLGAPRSELPGPLDSDVVFRLDKLIAGQSESRRAIVNDLLRRGLEALHRAPREQAGYSIESHDAGRCYVRDLDSTQDVLTFAEGEAHR